MPDFYGVIARRNIRKLEVPRIVRHAVVGIFRRKQPTVHPTVDVALNIDGFRLVDLLWNALLKLRLSDVEWTVHLAVAVDVMQDAIGVLDLDSGAGRKGQNVGMVFAALLVQRHLLWLHLL